MIAIVNYGLGNLHSVQKATAHVGGEAVVTEIPQVILNAEKVILPGQLADVIEPAVPDSPATMMRSQPIEVDDLDAWLIAKFFHQCRIQPSKEFPVAQLRA